MNKNFAARMFVTGAAAAALIAAPTAYAEPAPGCPDFDPDCGASVSVPGADANAGPENASVNVPDAGASAGPDNANVFVPGADANAGPDYATVNVPDAGAAAGPDNANVFVPGANANAGPGYFNGCISGLCWNAG